LERTLPLPLPRGARVALLVNDALGNLCVGTIVAQGLQHAALDLEVHWFGGPRTASLEGPHRYDAATVDPGAVGSFDAVVNLERDGRWPVLAGLLDADVRVGPLVVDRCPVPFASDVAGRLWSDPDWARADLRARHSIVSTPFIGEILYKACGLPPMEGSWPGDIPRYALATKAPPRDTPAVLLSTGGSRADKIWPLEKWLAVIDALDEPVGLLGADPKRQASDYHCATIDDGLVRNPRVINLRGRLSLPEVVGAVRNAELVVTVDNGILHFAAAFDRPTVGLFRARVERLWRPPNPNLEALSHPHGVPAIEASDVIAAASRVR
jgi:ADP-heptose:LPS heptosyltransferase